MKVTVLQENLARGLGVVGNIKEVSQNLLRAEDGHQQTIEHPDVAIQAADLGEVFRRQAIS